MHELQEREKHNIILLDILLTLPVLSLPEVPDIGIVSSLRQMVPTSGERSCTNEFELEDLLPEGRLWVWGSREGYCSYSE